MTGQAKRSSGPSKLVKPRPLANQITISLSRYMRESVPTMDTNSARHKMVGSCPSTVNPMTSQL